MPAPFPARLCPPPAAEPLDAATSILLVYLEPADAAGDGGGDGGAAGGAGSARGMLATYEIFLEKRGAGEYKASSCGGAGGGGGAACGEAESLHHILPPPLGCNLRCRFVVAVALQAPIGRVELGPRLPGGARRFARALTLTIATCSAPHLPRSRHRSCPSWAPGCRDRCSA